MEGYLADLTHALHQAHETARSKLRATQKRMKREYDVKVYRREFQEGDKVYLLDTAAVKGKTKKLCPPWKGPAALNREGTLSLSLSSFVPKHLIRS